jgi:hypothetical protein
MKPNIWRYLGVGLPVAQPNLRVLHLAPVEELDSAAEAVEAFQAGFDPNTDAAPPREPPIV